MFAYLTPPNVVRRKIVQNLVLNPKGMVVNVFSYRGRCIDWSSKRKTVRHLAVLLNLAPSTIGIVKLERLPGILRCERFLQQFQSDRIPSLFYSSAAKLQRHGVQLQRHFRNTIVQDLHPFVKQKTSKPPKTARAMQPKSSDQATPLTLDQAVPSDTPEPLRITVMPIQQLP